MPEYPLYGPIFYDKDKDCIFTFEFGKIKYYPNITLGPDGNLWYKQCPNN